MGSKFSPLAVRMRAYEAVREMTKDGTTLTVPEICARLIASGCRPPSRMTVSRWAHGATSPFSGKRLFQPNPSEELSFFLGAWLGDGWADESDGGKRMVLKVRSYDFAKEFADSAARILGKTDSYWVRRVLDKRGRWYLVKVTSVMLYEFVTQPIHMLIPITEPFPRGFLRGFFTAEGNPSVSIENSRPRYLGVDVTVANSDTALLNHARDLLFRRGFHPGRIRLNTAEGDMTNVGVARKTVMVFNLSRVEEVRRFVKEVGFADSEKQGKLTEAISLLDKIGRNAAVAIWLRHYHKPGRKWVKKDNPSP
ncbi:MAG TPA: LAGLIDADG family homing endonuclease [Nitrososphaerales archaeon]|nr:LAGLIDADG family homing endonuclease [Nitrososphaerales archaeon]